VPPGRFSASIKRVRHITGTLLMTGFMAMTNLLSVTVVADEPSFEELLRRREQIERFCRLLDHRRRFAICETYEKNRSKLPHTAGELELLRRAQNRTID
jgi:hypothetical protein